MSVNPQEEDWPTSCRCIAWHLGRLDAKCPEFGAVRSFMIADLAWRLQQMSETERKSFRASDLLMAFPQAIRDVLDVALPDVAGSDRAGKSNRVVVFVHGLGGNAVETWGKFGKLCKEDPDLRDFAEFDFYEYPTGFFSLPFVGPKFCSLEDLSQGLRTYLDHKLPRFGDVVLVCHSLGGLVARQYVRREAEASRPCRVKRMLFYATPHRGAILGDLASLISWRHKQLRQVCDNSDFVENLNRAWATLKLDRKIVRRYVVGGQDRIVNENSGKGEDGDENLAVIPFKGHRDLVKPDSRDDLSFIVFKRFVLGI